MTEEQKTTATKFTDAAKKVRALVRNMYRGAFEARSQGKKLAYCMVVSLYDEIVRAMDIFPVWTENYAGLCAAKRVAEPYLLKAEADGYSNLVCGYARTGIGFDIMRKELAMTPPDAPDGGMSAPDLLLGSSSLCDARYKWYQSISRYLDAPIYNIDVVRPPIGIDLREAQDYYVRYQTEELRGLVEFLESATRQKMNWERLDEIVELAEETRRIRWEAYELRKHLPCPMPGEDHFNAFAPSYFMLGTTEALEFYKDLYKELQEKVKEGLSPVKEEKYRLLWGGGLPPWHSMYIFNYFGNLGAVVVCETAYRAVEPVDVPPGISHPLEKIAWRAFKRFTWRHERARTNSGNPDVELLLELIEGYGIDGMVMHASKSCRATSIGQLHFKTLVQKFVDVPVMFMESDIVDLRDYSEAQTKNNIEAFMEAVAVRKARGQMTSSI